MPYDNFEIEYFNTGGHAYAPFHLRHKIYCEQYGFLPVTSDCVEIDEYDTEIFGAISAVISRVRTGEAVAVVRIIPAKRSRALPFDVYAPGYATAEHWGEVSRIGMVRGIVAAERAEVLGHLFKGVYQLSLALGVSHWVCMMPTALQLRLAMHDIYFEAVGGPVDYHGVRQPCVGVAHRILSYLDVENPELYQFIIER